MVIDDIKLDSSKTLPRTKYDGTNMIATVPPVVPGGQVEFNITYHYTLNKGSHIRTGEIEPGAYFIAYFFPRIAVYDDIDGWNKYPYLGPQEFYNDFCRFDVNISVPGGFAVWATGDLKNASQVLQPAVHQRMQQAALSDTVIEVISQADLGTSSFTTKNPTNTWHFTADTITDFAFAISDHYLWRSASVMVDPATGRRTRVDAVFNPIHKDYYEVIDFARQTVAAMSYRFPQWPFPYSHETVFDGLDQMEYPMMVNDNPVEDRTEAIMLTDHEIFHTMFPFYMGINETKYGWMDEGWATLGEWLISPMIDPAIEDDYGIKPYEKTAGKEIDLPISTLTIQLNGEPLFLNSYPKPALGYLYVKDALGDSLFTKALHFYIEHWHGKHPMPCDFFYSMNTGAGINLNWFWQSWFFEEGYPDLAIKNVTRNKNRYTVTILSKGNKPVPIDLAVYLKDGSKVNHHRSIMAWQDGNKEVTLNFTTDLPFTRLKLGSLYVADVQQKDNEYVMK